MAKTRIFLFGASGHAKVVIDILERGGGAKVVFLVDDDASIKGARLLGYPVIGGRPVLLARRKEAGSAIVSVGVNAARLALAAWLEGEGFDFACAVHPSAQVGREVILGSGTVVMAGAVVNPDCTVGCHCIVNTSASIDHDCRVGNGVHVAPGARLCGGVEVGDGAFIGAGAVVTPGQRVGADAIIGAGAVVLGNVPARAVVAGNPARIVRRLTKKR